MHHPVCFQVWKMDRKAIDNFPSSIPGPSANVNFQHKREKGLLHECKRHTGCSISSTPSVVLYWGIPPAGGTPHQTWLGWYPIPAGGYPTSGTPHQTWPGGTHPCCRGYLRHTPCWTWLQYPPSWTWLGYPPDWTWTGYPQLGLAKVPPTGPGWGTREIRVTMGSSVIG